MKVMARNPNITGLLLIRQLYLLVNFWSLFPMGRILLKSALLVTHRYLCIWHSTCLQEDKIILKCLPQCRQMWQEV